MFLVLSSEELPIWDEDEAAAERMLKNLILAMDQYSPIQAQRIHTWYVLKKKFWEIAEGKCDVCFGVRRTDTPFASKRLNAGEKMKISCLKRDASERK